MTITPVKMVIDTDPGVDDAMAILYVAHMPEIELLGLTSVFGNVSVEKATRNALRLVEDAGLNVPVAGGAAGPLARDAQPHSYHVHGAEGFGDIPAQTPKGRALDEDAADFLIRMAREHAGELVVCAIGPITNLAEAINRDAGFAKNVKRIVFMGGAAFVPGNVTPHAEANTFNDPHALNVVLQSGAPVTMVGLDVTMQILLDGDDFAALERANPNHGGFLNRASAFYLEFYRQVVGVAGCGLHDPAAVIACHRPDLFESRSVAIRVIEEGEEIGRTLPVDEGAPMVEVLTGGDMDGVKNLFLRAFGPATATA
ncbi:nucleoside hydrolase [Oceaniglobus trochenteri]|uniref:nucleoside hydrolase n=1 Tax=Oceaniglobus trochenteri TaxID=2763260 RepID=UPI001CFF8773|nr:nucleoside hydrolase [Oceaniglobus trochenteri]